MSAARWNIVIEQGANLVLELTWEADGTPVDLTGYTGAMDVRRWYAESDGNTVLTAETLGGGGNGFMTLGGALGTVSINIPAANTMTVAGGDYVYDIELTSGNGTVYRVAEGVAVCRPEVTR